MQQNKTNVKCRPSGLADLVTNEPVRLLNLGPYLFTPHMYNISQQVSNLPIVLSRPFVLFFLPGRLKHGQTSLCSSMFRRLKWNSFTRLFVMFSFYYCFTLIV